MCPLEYERSDIIREAHKLGYWGIDGVSKHIHKYHSLHWNSIYDDDDVKTVLLQCKNCARHNISKRSYNPLRPIVAFEPFSPIATDTCGPSPVTGKDNWYIIMMVDLCMKHIIARPVPNKQNKTIVDLLI
ncbi:hypothetical protein A0J61_08531 [Choanephora cucurbitarum]|uniref:Integrase zinc-binding domain-containing protein n=1 Tax=Choanephora cucurbitarum TaxID=101091 RepID=A0A1C7N2U6_9FUNG|nr:hypothetical protein A0J61_08531 [Choanephora cucurbitarum]